MKDSLYIVENKCSLAFALAFAFTTTTTATFLLAFGATDFSKLNQLLDLHFLLNGRLN